MTRILFFLTFIISVMCCACSGQQGAHSDAAVNTGDSALQVLKQKLETTIKPYKATVGIAILGIEDRDTISIHNNHHYPMLSVYKFPLAMAVLRKVDEGTLILNQKIHIDKEDLRPQTWSPLRDKYPDGNIDLTLKELLSYTVSNSDNNTCDILFKLIHGPKEVEQYIHKMGITDMAIATTEKEMAEHADVLYTNWTTPRAMVTLLDLFYHKKNLSDSSSALLMSLMTESANSANRLKGLLPAGTVVAHKTGTSDTNEAGMTAATNDVGIITLPNGKHIAIAVFVSDTMEPHDTNERIIADIAKTTFE